eukprot:CAMPEP_0179867752 /NCGR_PEP_ID=MMETSP0982-20121206/18379_1 /TAXON_ID=483367 /ORGANISM="non described non described, Strain CCMP 2436" /LENGTH=83 /DNA_ID=CAMNT_0021757215 /DNA_START=102 /DNA_END=349 /DNA_ORIENTATION=-
MSAFILDGCSFFAGQAGCDEEDDGKDEREDGRRGRQGCASAARRSVQSKLQVKIDSRSSSRIRTSEEINAKCQCDMYVTCQGA